MAESIVITAGDRAELRRLRKKVDGIRGPGVRHTKDSVYIGPPLPTPATRGRRGVPQLWVVVDSAEVGPGMYKGFEFIWNSTPVDPTNAVSTSALGAVQTEELLIINASEANWSTGHMLTDGDIQNVVLFGADWHPGGAPDTLGRRVAVISGIDLFICDSAADPGAFSSF